MKPELHCDPTHMPMLRSMFVLQEKWVLFVLWELLQHESLGFNELTRRSPVNPTTLAQRLDLLEHEGLVTRTVHSAIPPKTSYALTKKGLALRPVFEAIRTWAAGYPAAVGEPTECAKPEDALLESAQT